MGNKKTAQEEKPDNATGSIQSNKKTMLNYILWYNDVELSQVQKWCKDNDDEISYVTLHQLKQGFNRHFGKRTLRAVANAIGIQIADFYDLENKMHKYYEG